MITPLNALTAKSLSAKIIALPQYTQANLHSGIVHIGLGAFHRGHQALYTHETMNISQDTTWGITAASLFSQQNVIVDLVKQQGLYSVLELNPDGSQSLKLCSAIKRALAACQNRLPLIEVMASPQTRIVSLTITEKGYCLNPANGALLTNSPLISHDIKHPEHPMSAMGVIVAALAIRYKKSIPAFTVLSCDNCTKNGEYIKSAVVQLASFTNKTFANWIQENVCFPSTMVDRIVPTQTHKERQQIKTALGLDDHCGIVCESFRQWVIEDNFSLGHPAWNSVDGALFVNDVAPYETMKLRMLNGAHSFIAYLGYLGGYSTVYETLENPVYCNAVKHLLYHEVIPGLSAPEGIDLTNYAQSLMQRFRNPHIAHHTLQIAMDGSQKIPQRWLGTVMSLLKKGRPFPAIALGIAAWMFYVSGKDKNDQPIDVQDPMVETFRTLAKMHRGNTTALIHAFLALDTIFDRELSHNPIFVDAVIHAYQQIKRLGVCKAVAAISQ